MASSLIQQKSGNNTSTTALVIPFTSNTLAGDLVIVAINVDKTSEKISSVTAPGMTFNKITGASGLIGGGAASYLSVWYAYNIGAQTTPSITINKSATAGIEAVINHYRGLVSASDPLDISSRRQTGTASPVQSGTSGTLAQADELVVGMGGDDWGTGITYTVGSGYGNLLQKTATAGTIAIQDKVVAATTGVSSSMAINQTTDNAGMLVTFKIASTAQALTLPFIATAESILAMTLFLNIVLPVIASAAALYAPTIANGPITIVLPFIAAVDTLYGPIVLRGAVELVLPAISSAAVLNAPSLQAINSLSLPTIASTETVNAPTVAAGPATLTLPHINSEAIYAPVVTAGGFTIILPHINSEQVFAPVVQRAQDPKLLPIAFVG